MGVQYYVCISHLSVCTAFGRGEFERLSVNVTSELAVYFVILFYIPDIKTLIVWCEY